MASRIRELEELFSEEHRAVSFRARPDPIPGDLRLAWRLAALSLALNRFRAHTAHVRHLHLLVSALRSPTIQSVVLRSLSGGATPNDFLVRFDPSLTRTIKLAVATELVDQTPSFAYKLMPSGRALAESVWSDQSIMTQEKKFLDRLPRRISQKSLNAVLEAR